MPFIPAESRTIRRSSLIEPLVRDVKDGVIRLTAYPDEAIHSRPIPTKSTSRLIPRKSQYTTLVDEFILSCKELEAYKFVAFQFHI